MRARARQDAGGLGPALERSKLPRGNHRVRAPRAAPGSAVTTCSGAPSRQRLGRERVAVVRFRRVPRRERVPHALADAHHAPEALVPADRRERSGADGVRALDDVEVRGVHRRGDHLDEDVVGSEGRDGHLPEPERLGRVTVVVVHEREGGRRHVAGVAPGTARQRGGERARRAAARSIPPRGVSAPKESVPNARCQATTPVGRQPLDRD